MSSPRVKYPSKKGRVCYHVSVWFHRRLWQCRETASCAGKYLGRDFLGSRLDCTIGRIIPRDGCGDSTPAPGPNPLKTPQSKHNVVPCSETSATRTRLCSHKAPNWRQNMIASAALPRVWEKVVLKKGCERGRVWLGSFCVFKASFCEEDLEGWV
ncbi:uncharacterized protein YALI1_C31061g [Yarrowia lipolytica]|uniref:Uncharacterized protein n=1 Tax=Yarrowia lipolytica TaxID=4952 RepID=A0A1D8NCA7_YARLL|nr:hypothetical protein YALI1_C31061g [Yarrowia lipolytica]